MPLDPLERASQIVNQERYSELAQRNKELYDAHVGAGFSRVEALAVVLKVLELGKYLNARKR
jgi:hypothetical protein